MQVHEVHTVPISSILAQMSAVLDDIGADVIKTGMLPSPEVGCCLPARTSQSA